MRLVVDILGSVRLGCQKVEWVSWMSLPILKSCTTGKDFALDVFAMTYDSLFADRVECDCLNQCHHNCPFDSALVPCILVGVEGGCLGLGGCGMPFRPSPSYVSPLGWVCRNETRVGEAQVKKRCEIVVPP
ncbi:hypothetical protein VNO78_19702 [Psophocarpus tetragonolobus]|uniref:Uncharacterized protein n=1 Tax=Psophocarpus tetragonolobus TaxID=3891 RepID=A0AAN9S814_PSOTE